MILDKYNSFLYGNGLTVAILGQIKKHFSFTPIDRYLDFNTFFNDFIQAENHKRILRDFYKYFEIDEDSLKTHTNTRSFLRQRKDEILKMGFEKWVSKYLFDKESKITKEVSFYVYILYNYWYHLIYQNILTKPVVIKLLHKSVELIKQKIILNNNIYTLNFDTILDEYLNPRHLHGVFALPLFDIKELILHFFSEDEFEYIYLFGSNGIEKLARLDKIRKLKQKRYDLELFYNSEVNLEHLLIYGISFSNTEFMTPTFLEQHPKHENEYYVRSVDGHILLKLNQLYKSQRVEKITISYYSQNDLANYKNILGFTDFNPIVEYQQSSEVFDFDNISKNTV